MDWDESFLTNLTGGGTLTVLGEVHGELESEKKYVELAADPTRPYVDTENPGLFKIPSLEEAGISINVVLLGMFGAGSYDIPDFYEAFSRMDTEKIKKMTRYILNYPQIFGNIYHWTNGSLCLNLGQQGERDTKNAAIAAGDEHVPMVFHQWNTEKICLSQKKSAGRTSRPIACCTRCGGTGNCRTARQSRDEGLRAPSDVSSEVQKGTFERLGALRNSKKRIMDYTDELTDVDKYFFLSDLVAYYIKQAKLAGRDQNLTIICTSCQVIHKSWLSNSYLPRTMTEGEEEEENSPIFLLPNADRHGLNQMNINFARILLNVESARMKVNTNYGTKYNPKMLEHRYLTSFLLMTEEDKIAASTWAEVTADVKKDLEGTFTGIIDFWKKWRITCFQMESFSDFNEGGTYFPFPASTVPDYKKYIDAAIQVYNAPERLRPAPRSFKVIGSKRQKRQKRQRLGGKRRTRRKKRKTRRKKRKSRRKRKTKRKSKGR